MVTTTGGRRGFMQRVSGPELALQRGGGLLERARVGAGGEVLPAPVGDDERDIGVPAGGDLRLRAEGISIEGDEVAKVVMLPMGPAGPGAERLRNAGLELRTEDGQVLIDAIGFGSAAEKAGLEA